MQSHDYSEADSGHVGYRAMPEPEWAIQSRHQLALPDQRPLNLDAFGYLHPVDPSHIYYPEYSQQRFDPVHPSDQGHHCGVYDNGAHYEEPHKHGYEQHHEHPHEQSYAHSYDQSYGNGPSPPKDELDVSFLSAPPGSANEVGLDQILDHNAVVADHEGQYAYLPEPEHPMHHSHFTHVHEGEALPLSPLNLDAIPSIYQPYREAPIYSPSASSFFNSSFSDTSNTRSASSAANSEYGFDTEEAALAHSSSTGPMRTCQSPASHRNSPYPSRRASCSSNTSLNRGSRDKLATLDVASQAQAGGSLATPATGNLSYLDSAPSGTSTISGIYDSTLRVPQPHYGYQVQSVASPGFYEPPQQHFQTLDPRSTPPEESFPHQKNQYSYEASSWVPYQFTDDDDERPTRHSRDTTVRASQFPTTAPLLEASDGIPDSEFYVTPQGTIPGARTVINGLNPSTSGAFRDDYDAAMLATLNTKAPRGRKALVPASVGLPDGVDPNREPTEAIVDFVGTTKRGRLKKVYQCKVPGCGNFFKRAEHLKRHVRSIHTNEKPFVCPYERCGKTFTRVDNMNQHIRVHEKRVEAGEDPVPPPEPRKSRAKPKPKKAVKKNKDDDEFVPGFETLS